MFYFFFKMKFYTIAVILLFPTDKIATSWAILPFLFLKKFMYHCEIFINIFHPLSSEFLFKVHLWVAQIIWDSVKSLNVSGSKKLINNKIHRVYTSICHQIKRSKLNQTIFQHHQYANNGSFIDYWTIYYYE